MSKLRVGIFGLTGCAGDQLVLLNAEDELLELAALLDVRDFLLACSANDHHGELDLALVEGAVLSRRDEEQLRRIRERSRLLVALGACAVAGGVQAAESDGRAERLAEIYGAAGATYDSLPARALHEVVKVDAALPGCPVEKRELLQAIAHLLNGNLPLPAAYPVCAECRLAENRCLMTPEAATACCGPITVGGCGARCPGLGAACLGCRGPVEDANVPAALLAFQRSGLPRERALARVRTFSGRAPLGGGL